MTIHQVKLKDLNKEYLEKLQVKAAYENILVDSTKMVKDDSFESLLNLASQAYLKKTGKVYEHIPAYIYET